MKAFQGIGSDGLRQQQKAIKDLNGGKQGQKRKRSQSVTSLLQWNSLARAGLRSHLILIARIQMTKVVNKGGEGYFSCKPHLSGSLFPHIEQMPAQTVQS
jgi:hypothetical protein